MKVYIFEDVLEVSGAYHQDGGVVFVASSKEEVITLAAHNGNIVLTDEDWETVKVLPLDNDFVTDSKVYVFPDTGCC